MPVPLHYLLAARRARASISPDSQLGPWLWFWWPVIAAAVVAALMLTPAALLVFGIDIFGRLMEIADGVRLIRN